MHENSKNKDISLLKRRVEFLSLLKTVKKGKNGNLLAGIAHNYQYTTDNFECLKIYRWISYKSVTEPEIWTHFARS